MADFSRKLWFYFAELKDGLPLIWLSVLVAWITLLFLIVFFGDIGEMNNLVLNIFFIILVIAISLSLIVFLEIICFLFFLLKSDKTKFVLYGIIFGLLIYLVIYCTKGLLVKEKVILDIALIAIVYSVARGALYCFKKSTS